MTERNAPSAGCVKNIAAPSGTPLPRIAPMGRSYSPLLREIVDQVGVFDRFQQVLRINAE